MDRRRSLLMNRPTLFGLPAAGLVIAAVRLEAPRAH